MRCQEWIPGGRAVPRGIGKAVNRPWRGALCLINARVLFLPKRSFSQAIPQSEDLWEDSSMSDMEDLQKKAIEFRNERDWKQFHNPKDMALSLVLEATEVLEHFQWKVTELEMSEYIKENKEEIGDELADVLFWVLTMSNDLGIDLKEAFARKIEKNIKKYPVEKSKGKHTKYTDL